jgi:hypothetical protein
MSAKKRPAFLICFILLLAAVIGVESGLKSIIGHATISPPLSIICLALLAAFFSWQQVLFATPFFALVSFALIHDVAVFPSVRAFSVIIGGGLAGWIAFQRGQATRRSTEIALILQNLPVAWILSDASGNITHASQNALSTLTSLTSGTIIGSSYFSFFSPSEGKGVFIQKYLDAFALNSPPITLNLSLSKHSIKPVRATLSCVHLSQGPLLLTVFG